MNFILCWMFLGFISWVAISYRSDLRSRMGLDDYLFVPVLSMILGGVLYVTLVMSLIYDIWFDPFKKV